MKSLKVLGGASAMGIITAAMVAVPVFACFPQGKIVKTVQDVTSKSAVSDANEAANALSVIQGDVLTYTVTVSNQETKVGSKGEDQMTNTTLTDTLPAGVQLSVTLARQLLPKILVRLAPRVVLRNRTR